jgi:hypothetical protein
MMSDSAAHAMVDPPEPASLASAYETLRMAALGEPLPPECRGGLALFLRSGMWGWAQSLIDARVSLQPTRAPATTSPAGHGGRAVVQLLAAMALGSNLARER